MLTLVTDVASLLGRLLVILKARETALRRTELTTPIRGAQLPPIDPRAFSCDQSGPRMGTVTQEVDTD
jgi:hypothetical protein